MQSSWQLSMNDILKDAQRIHEYRGDDSYALTSFLREVESVFALVDSNDDVKKYIYQRVILNKLQGEALHVMRTLGPNPTWGDVKEALICNFGVKESYHQLYQEAFEARNFNIENYYNKLVSILCKINEKYEYDNNKPVEFSPEHAEKIILKTFINNIDVNLASVVINRNINKIRDAYNLLKLEGLIRVNNNQKNVKFYKNTNDHGTSSEKFNKSNKRFSNENNNSANGNSRCTFSNSQYNRNGSYSQNNSYNVERHNGPSTSYNTGNSQRTYQSRNNSSNMEVDHIEEVDDNSISEEQINFHMAGHINHYQ